MFSESVYIMNAIAVASTLQRMQLVLTFYMVGNFQAIVLDFKNLHPRRGICYFCLRRSIWLLLIWRI